jgi:hypothetical protein
MSAHSAPAKKAGKVRSVPFVNCSPKLHNRRVVKPTQANLGTAQVRVPGPLNGLRGLRAKACLVCAIDCSQRPIASCRPGSFVSLPDDHRTRATVQQGRLIDLALRPPLS